MTLFGLAARSLLNRKGTALLTVLAMTLSVTLLLGVERIRQEARDSFMQAVSGTDLIVGARSSQTQLLLYSVFRMGNATNNISWQSYEELRQHPSVAWTIPLSLGDSHRGYPVLGTSLAYFELFRFGAKRPLEFAQGTPFKGLHEVVAGAEVAARLNYRIGQKIVIAHGSGNVSFVQHDDQPFTLVGILKPTGTPVDRTLHVSLEALEAIHAGWQQGYPARNPAAGELNAADLQPRSITAALVGLKSRIAAFRLQRDINEYPKEPLTAIMPGVALQEFWQLIGVAEKALLGVSAFVVLSGLIGMMTSLLTSLNERRREMAILRSVGARPWQVFGLLVSESFLLSLAGCLFGLLALYGLLALGKPWLETQFGLFLSLRPPAPSDWLLLGTVLGLGTLTGLIPAWRAYRQALADGLSIRT